MTIRAINSTHIKQECDACHSLNLVDSSNIIVGIGSPGHFAFPPCASCGATEYGRRQGANSDPNEFDSEHNAAVNFAHRLGVERGKVFVGAESSIKTILAQEKGRGRWADFTPKRLIEPTNNTFIPVKSNKEEFENDPNKVKPPLPNNKEENKNEESNRSTAAKSGSVKSKMHSKR